VNMTPEKVELIQQAIDAAMNPGDTPRDVLEQKHGVWRWRVIPFRSQHHPITLREARAILDRLPT
jgi:hypothetical protein